MIKPYDIINDTWEVRHKIGHGAFSQLVVGRNIQSDFDASIRSKFGGNSSNHDSQQGIHSTMLSTSQNYPDKASETDSIPQDQLVAIKISDSSIDGGVLRWEADVLAAFNVDFIPKLIYQGSSEGQDYIVMELFGGEDMSKLRDRVREASNTGLISIQATSYLVLQMLKCIKKMHEQGFVHRDIKPANFVRKTRDSTEFAIIDFGITKQVCRNQSGWI